MSEVFDKSGIAIPKWKEVVFEEMRALHKNGLGEVVAYGKKTRGCKWVFSIKYKVDG